MPNERPKLSRNPIAGWKVLPNVGGDSPLMKVHDKKHLQLSSPDWEAMFRLAPPSIRAFAALWVRFQPTIQQECTLWRLEDTSSVNSRHLTGIFVRTHHCADSNAQMHGAPVMIDTTTLVDAGEVTLYCSLWLQTMWSHSKWTMDNGWQLATLIASIQPCSKNFQSPRSFAASQIEAFTLSARTAYRKAVQP